MYALDFLLQRIRDEPVLLYYRESLKRLASDSYCIERATSSWKSLSNFTW